MSNQVRGMSQANRNAQDANNLLATAESGLSDISDVLSKMRELSVQAATDTLNDHDRSSIDLEFQSLKDELTRIANVTEYNGMNVLNGTYQQGGGLAPSSLFSNQNNTGNVAYDQVQPGVSPGSVNENGPGDDIRGHWRLQIGADNDINNQHEFSVMNATANGLDLNIDKSVGTLAEFAAVIANGDLEVYVNSSGEFVGGNEAGAIKLVVEDVATVATLKAGASGTAITKVGLNGSDEWVVSVGGTVATGKGLDDTNGPDFGWNTYDANVRHVNAARSAVTHLDAAIDEINRERSYVGSEQNKLQFTMSNLTSNIQSIESARSSIEDVDFAAEAADLAKNQILAQSGTAMLAQASAISQNILSLIVA